MQSLWENRVDFNLTESGVHPFTLNELLDQRDVAALANVRLGYGQTNGSIALRESIAGLYPGVGSDNVLVTNGSAEANFVAIWSTLDSGDEIVYMVPNYLQIRGVSRAMGVHGLHQHRTGNSERRGGKVRTAGADAPPHSCA